MTLKEAENAIVEEFSMYEEWLDKYEYIIELGKALKDYPEEDKTDEKLIKGCQSRVWLTVLPCESVTRPSSNTCNKILNTSGCAFSISSNKTTEYGLLLTASVS